MKDKKLEVEVADTLESVDKESLLLFPNNDPCYSYGWLKTIEDSKASFKVEPRYFLVHEKTNLVSFVPTYKYPYSTIFNVKNKSPIIKTTVNALRRFGINLDRGRILVCEPPGSPYTRLLAKQDCNMPEVFKALSTKVDEVCREEKIFTSNFSSVLANENFHNNLQDSSYGYVNTTKTGYLKLDVTWSSFEDYLYSLSNRHRNNVRREIRKCRESGIVINLEKDFNKCSQTLANLYSNLYCKYQVSEEKSPFNASFFDLLYKNAKGSTKIFLATKNDDIVGFSMVLQYKKTFDVMMVGFKYSALTKTDFVYFNLAYYEPIRMAIRNNIERMYYHQGAEEAKLNRNCQQNITYSYTKIHNRALGFLYKYRNKFWS